MELGRKAALQAMFRLSVDTELALFHDSQKNGPLLAVLVAARNDAIGALVGLAKQDPADVEAMRKLQNEVQRFIDLVTHTKGIIESGEQAQAELEPEAQQEIRDLLLAENGEQADEHE